MPFRSLLPSFTSYVAFLLIVTGSVADPTPAPGAKFLQPLPKTNSSMGATPDSPETYGAEGGLLGDIEDYRHGCLNLSNLNLSNLSLSSGLSHHLSCDADCWHKGEIHSCRDRVEWLRGGGWTLHDSIEQVSDDCQKQCSCRYDDFHKVPAPPAPQTPRAGWMEGQPLCYLKQIASFQGSNFVLYNKFHRQYLSTNAHNVDLHHSPWEGAFWQLQYTPHGYYLVNSWQQKYMDSYERTKDDQKNVHLWVGNGLEDQGAHPENHRWHFLAAEHSIPRGSPCSFYIKHDASGQYLDVYNGNVQLYRDLFGTPDLQWQLVPIHDQRL